MFYGQTAAVQSPAGPWEIYHHEHTAVLLQAHVVKQVERPEADNICTPQFSWVTSGHPDVADGIKDIQTCVYVIKYGISWLKDATSVVQLDAAQAAESHKRQS